VTTAGTEINPLYERHKKVEAKRATENLIQKVANINASEGFGKDEPEA